MSLPIQIKTFNDLGGIQTKKALTSFLDRDALSCVGGTFDKPGQFFRRMGGEKYNQTATGFSITGLYDFRYNNNTLSKFIICSGADIYTGAAGVLASIKAGQTPGAFYNFASYEGYLHISNGADTVLKYDGTTVTQQGITRPATQPTVTPAVGAGTLPIGNYLIAVTFINDSDPNNLIESNPCDLVAGTLAGAQNQFDLTVVPVSADPQVTKRGIYITDAGGTLLRLHGTINDNVAVIYTINSPATGRVLEYDHDTAPAALDGIVYHKDSLFGFKGSFIYFTKKFQPWYWPQGTLADADGTDANEFFFQVGDEGPVTCLVSFFDVLLVFKGYDVYILSGDNEINYNLERAKSDERRGCTSKRGALVIGNYCYFVGFNSVYRTNGITVEDVGKPIESFFNGESDFDQYNVNKQQLQDCVLLYYEQKNFLLFFVATSTNTVNNMCFYMDTNSVRFDQASSNLTADWCPWPGFTTESAALIVENNVDEWFRGDDLGYVFRQERLFGDGADITSTVTASGAATLTDNTQAWTINAYVGLRVTILSGTGINQEGIITANNADTLTVSPAWGIVPPVGSRYCIGGIPFHYWHAWDDYENPSLSKRLVYIRPRFESLGVYDVLIYYYDFNNQPGDFDTKTITLNIAGQSLWDDPNTLWDVDIWDGVGVVQNKVPGVNSRIHRWGAIKMENNAAGQPFGYNGIDKMYQVKGIR